MSPSLTITWSSSTSKKVEGEDGMWSGGGLWSPPIHKMSLFTEILNCPWEAMLEGSLYPPSQHSTLSDEQTLSLVGVEDLFSLYNCMRSHLSRPASTASDAMLLMSLLTPLIPWGLGEDSLRSGSSDSGSTSPTESPESPTAPSLTCQRLPPSVSSRGRSPET